MKSITQQLIEERDEELAKELEIVVNEVQFIIVQKKVLFLMTLQSQEVNSEEF